MCNMAISIDGKIFCDYFDFGVVECGEVPCPEDDENKYYDFVDCCCESEDDDCDI